MFKRLSLLSLLLVSGIFISERVMAQRILGGISAGINLTQVDGDDLYGFNKVGFNAGPMVIVPLGKSRNWSASMELLYSQKGSSHWSSVDSAKYQLKLDYAEVPLIIHYTDKKLISGGIGFSYGRLINYRETKNKFYDSLYKYQTALSYDDISILGDVQIRIWSKLWVDLRYQYTMKSLRTVSVDKFWLAPRNEPVVRKQYNNVISLRLTWIFNQPKIEKHPTKQGSSE
ncbi:MAG: outer membrane beta-barrel protein [Bacteroidota bacterium]